jgi:hypothetical protein
MLSVGFWRWYINITITILDIIHRPVFYLKKKTFWRLDSVSVFRWKLLIWDQYTELVTCLRTVATAPIGCPEIETNSVDWAKLSIFHLKTEKESNLRNVFQIKERTMDNAVIVTLAYCRHNAMVLTMVYNTQNFRVPGLCPAFVNLNTTKYYYSICFRLQVRKRDTYLPCNSEVSYFLFMS